MHATALPPPGKQTMHWLARWHADAGTSFEQGSSSKRLQHALALLVRRLIVAQTA